MLTNERPSALTQQEYGPPIEESPLLFQKCRLELCSFLQDFILILNAIRKSTHDTHFNEVLI